MGLVVTGALVVVALGGPALDNVSDQTEKDVAQDSLSEASASLSTLAGDTGDRSTSFTIPHELGGDVSVRESSANVTINVSAVEEAASASEPVDLGTISYEQDGETIALQSGGVWRISGDDPVMVSPPSVSFSDGQLRLALIDLTRSESISKGEVVATRNTTGSQETTDRVMGNLSTVWEDPDVEAVNVTVAVESEFAEAWRTYAERNFEGNVTIESGDDSVEMTFHGLPAERGAVAPLEASTVSTSGPAPTGSGPGREAVSSSSGLSRSATADSETPWDGWGSPGRSATDDVAGSDRSASDSVRPWSDTTRPGANESEGRCPGDRNRGHGNDCNNFDPDNPGNNNRAETAQPGDSDGDGVPDRDDDCPDVPGAGSNGCPIVSENPDGLVANAESASVTHLGTQIGQVNETDIVSERVNPMDLAFVLDESGSMGDLGPGGQPKIEGAKQATRSFVGSIPEDEGHRLSMLGYTAPCADWILYSCQRRIIDVTTYEGLTGDQQAINDSIDLISANSGTPIGAGIREGVDELAANGNESRDRIMVLLTDGRQNTGEHPTYGADSPTDEAVDEDVTIYTVGYGENAQEWLMQDIAGQTGGQYYYADDAEALQDTFDRIARNASTQRIRAIDRNPARMDVQFGNESWSLQTVNDPTVVDPTDPEPRTRQFDVAPGAILDLQTTVYELEGLAQSDTTQTYDGTDYVHRGGSAAGERGEYSQYAVYTDGDTVQPSAAWWQQDAATLLEDVDATMDGDTVRLAEDRALVEVATPDGYSLLLVEGTDVDRPPVPVLTVENPEPTADRPVSVDASDSFDPDPDDDIVAYKFGDGDWQDSPTAEVSFDRSGAFTLTVRNDDGETASVSQAVTISNRPVVANLTTDDRTVFKGETVDLDASESDDPDDGDGIRSFDWSGNVDASGETATATFDHGGTGVRERTVAVTVEGQDGTVASASLDVAVENRRPELTVSADQATVAPGSTVGLTANATDPDPDESVEEYRWRNVDGASGETATASFGSTGEQVIEVTAVSTDGTSTTANLTVAVERSVDLTADDWVYKGEDPNLRLSNAGTVERWLVDGTEQPSMSGTDPSVSWDLLDRAGNVTKNVTAVVEKGGTVATPSASVEVRNREPVAELQAGKDTVYVGETVELDATGSSDPDGGETVAGYRWSNVDSSTGGTAEVSFPSDGAETVSVTVESSDGTTTTVDLDVGVEPRDPVASLETNSTWIYEGGTVELDASNASAPAGASIVDYDWRNVDTESGDTATARFDDSGTETIDVTIESSDGTTDTASVDVEVRDRAPVAELEARSVSAPDGVLELDASGSYDPDPGDSATVRDIDVVSQPGSGARLDGSGEARTLENVSESGVYRFEAVVESDGETASTEVTVSIGLGGSNSPASVSVVEVEAQNN